MVTMSLQYAVANPKAAGVSADYSFLLRVKVRQDWRVGDQLLHILQRLLLRMGPRPDGVFPEGHT